MRGRLRHNLVRPEAAAADRRTRPGRRVPRQVGEFKVAAAAPALGVGSQQAHLPGPLHGHNRGGPHWVQPRDLMLRQLHLAHGLAALKEKQLSALAPGNNTIATYVQHTSHHLGRSPGRERRPLRPDGIVVLRQLPELQMARAEGREVVHVGVHAAVRHDTQHSSPTKSTRRGHGDHGLLHVRPGQDLPHRQGGLSVAADRNDVAATEGEPEGYDTLTDMVTERWQLEVQGLVVPDEYLRRLAASPRLPGRTQGLGTTADCNRSHSG
mmetsp:Transcript_53989/g.143706  ORF Transcript_53989/g.143706 Transcript_53989/m.143706 type:complete len:267 (-) Transcript_53989:253-1053(-)